MPGSPEESRVQIARGNLKLAGETDESDEMALLMKKPVAVCLQCHPDADHGQHSSRQPPVSEQATRSTDELGLQDPMRPDKPFYCGSCHNPHSSDGPLLFNFNARSLQDLCQRCHMKN